MIDTKHPTMLHSLMDDGQPAPEAEGNELAISILIMDRRSFMRECLARCLALELPKCRVSTGPDRLDDETLSQFDMLILGVSTVNNRQAALFEKLHSLAKKFSVIVVSDNEDASCSQEMFRAGVRAHIVANQSFQMFNDILRIVHGGGTYFPTSILSETNTKENVRIFATENNINMLTSRELDVLRLLGEGKQNKVIAYELDICDNTVKVHVRHVMAKLGATNRTQAALMAREMLNEEY